jgi:leucine dehydrogenase
VSVWSQRAFDGHELLVHHRDSVSGLSAIVAIHAHHEGRSCGGCRMRAYATDEDALEDVLRLSRAMSYKAAMADVPAGGAKSVIVGDPRRDKSEQLLLAMGRLIESFGGAYIAAPDIGIGMDDLRIFRRESRWVVGVDEVMGPSAAYTALGVFEGLRSAVRHRLGRDDLDGLRVGIQGVGSVGRELARLLNEAGVRLVVADIDPDAVRSIVAAHKADVVGVDEILFADVDVLSPNALGAVLDDRTIPRIRAQIVCGAANNQLADDRHGVLLHERGILFAPDYVVNAGGLIAGMEELRGFDPEAARARVRAIGDTLAHVLADAEAERIPESEAADRIARLRIDGWRRAADGDSRGVA